MLVLGAHNKDRKSTRDQANICNPKVNRGCPPLTANRTSADFEDNSLGPSVQYIPQGVYHTRSFNAMKMTSGSLYDGVQKDICLSHWITPRIMDLVSW